MTRTDLQVNFRMPAALKAQLETAATKNNRSTTAELVARLQETFAVEEALQIIAPGASIDGVGNFLLQLDSELEEARDELQHLNLSVHAKAMNDQLSYSTAMLEKIESRIEYLIDLAKPS